MEAYRRLLRTFQSTHYTYHFPLIFLLYRRKLRQNSLTYGSHDLPSSIGKQTSFLSSEVSSSDLIEGWNVMSRGYCFQFPLENDYLFVHDIYLVSIFSLGVHNHPSWSLYIVKVMSITLHLMDLCLSLNWWNSMRKITQTSLSLSTKNLTGMIWSPSHIQTSIELVIGPPTRLGQTAQVQTKKWSPS